MIGVNEKVIRNIRDKVQKEHIGRKEPVLALALSLCIPGAGQIYCGLLNEGVGHLIIAIIGYAILVVPGVGFALFSAIHARNMAIVINNIHDEFDVIEESDKRSTIKSNLFILELQKQYKLFQNEMISIDEFTSKKVEIIESLAGKKIDCDKIDFLSSLIPLKEQQILDKADIDKIKGHIGN